MKLLKKLFKHKHKWVELDNWNLYEEGWDYWCECKCGAIKRKFMGREEIVKENKYDKDNKLVNN